MLVIEIRLEPCSLLFTKKEQECSNLVSTDRLYLKQRVYSSVLMNILHEDETSKTEHIKMDNESWKSNIPSWLQQKAAVVQHKTLTFFARINDSSSLSHIKIHHSSGERGGRAEDWMQCDQKKSPNVYIVAQKWFH